MNLTTVLGLSYLSREDNKCLLSYMSLQQFILELLLCYFQTGLQEIKQQSSQKDYGNQNGVELIKDSSK